MKFNKQPLVTNHSIQITDGMSLAQILEKCNNSNAYIDFDYYYNDTVVVSLVWHEIESPAETQARIDQHVANVAARAAKKLAAAQLPPKPLTAAQEARKREKEKKIEEQEKIDLATYRELHARFGNKP